MLTSIKTALHVRNSIRLVRIVDHPFTIRHIHKCNKELRNEVIGLYKNLIYLSREWPTDLRPQIRKAFQKNRDVTDPEEIKKLVARGEYVCREITATYHLRKYRAMKRRYYNEDENLHLQELFKSFN